MKFAHVCKMSGPLKNIYICLASVPLADPISLFIIMNTGSLLYGMRMYQFCVIFKEKIDKFCISLLEHYSVEEALNS
jgi:hypothetical protein